jgi:chain length determinant protein (polysaccharide antigen chain regulator)
MQGKVVGGSPEGDAELVEFLRALLARKLLIGGVALIGALLGLVYVLMTTPIYEAKGVVLPPKLNGIAELNIGRTSEAELTPYTVAAVYGVFVRNLNSETLRRRFFEEQYLPSLSDEERAGSKGVLYSNFSRMLSVGLVNKAVPDRYGVVVQHPDPALAEKWAALYIEQAASVATEEVVHDARREAGVRAKNLGQQITALRESGNKIREDSISQLREALRIADAIKLREPPLISGKLANNERVEAKETREAKEFSADMENNLIYMRGTKALEAEIYNLEHRVSDDPFIANLRPLEAKYEFFKRLEDDVRAVSVFQYDGPVSVSDGPVKPKRLLSVIGGGLIGMTVGILFACVGYLLAGGRGRRAGE